MSVNILTNLDPSKHPNSTVSCRTYDLYVDNNIYDQNQQSGSVGDVLSKNNSNELVWTPSPDLGTNMETIFVVRSNPFNFLTAPFVTSFNSIIYEDPGNYILDPDGSVRVLSSGLYYVDFNFSECFVTNDSTTQSFTIKRDFTIPNTVKYLVSPLIQQASINNSVTLRNTALCELRQNERIFIESARESGSGTVSVGTRVNVCSLMITKFSKL